MRTRRKNGNAEKAKTESPPHSHDARRASGLRLRFDPSRRAPATEPATPRAAFDSVVDGLREKLPLRAVALVPRDTRDRPLVWCASRHERDFIEADAIATATVTYFDTDDDHAAVSTTSTGSPSPRWTTLPLVGRDLDVVGALAIATAIGGIDDATLAFAAGAAGQLGPIVARVATAPVDSGVMLRADVRQDVDVIVAELSTMLFDSLDFRSTLRQLTRAVASQLALACVVDVTRGSSRLHIVHAPSLSAPALSGALDPLVARVINGGAPIDDEVDEVAAAAAATLGGRSLLCLPLRMHDDVFGALTIVGHPAHGILLGRAQAEHLARATAAAVHNGQLYESALASTRIRDELLATVSHDLKNPLGVILMSAAHMLDPRTDESEATGRRRIETIQRCAQRMRRLVGDLLDVAATEAGAVKLRPRAQRVSDLVGEALQAAASSAAQAGVKLHDGVPASLPLAFVDEDRVLQVLSNLIGNAIKFTPAGGSVSVLAAVKQSKIELAIADTGVGIPRASLPHIFTRFWQADATRKQGSGLGLAICKSLVELWGGTIDAASIPGSGTSIMFTLPIEE